VSPQWAARSSSHGVFQRSPLHQYQRRTSAPCFHKSHGQLPTRGAKMPPFARAPLLPFHPASAVSSVRPLAGLLRPATGPEVRLVSDRWRHRRRALLLGACKARVPPQRRGSHPSEPSPRRPPYRVTAALAFLPLLSSDFKAFLVRRVRCPALALPPATTRCSPGLRSPSGVSPIDQSVLYSGSMGPNRTRTHSRVTIAGTSRTCFART